MEKLISIIVPIYNVGQYLDQCVQSLSSQTYQNLEILLIDDGATDNSPEICDRWGEKDARIRVIHKANGGLSDARNVGIRESKGDYVTLIDGDDWLDEQTCELALKGALEQNADIVMWPYVREFPNESKPKHLFDSDRLFERDEVKNGLARRMAGVLDNELRNPAEADSIVMACAKLYRGSILRDHGLSFVDLKIIGTHEDGLFNLEAFCFADRVLYINQYWYHYRKAIPGQLTRTYRKDLYDQYQTLISMLESKGKALEIRDIDVAIRNRVCLSMIVLSRNICRAPFPFRKKVELIREILRNPRYAEGLREIPIGGMQPHWRAFFFCCKHSMAAMVAVLAEITLHL